MKAQRSRISIDPTSEAIGFPEGSNGGCVELACDGEAVRDLKQPDCTGEGVASTPASLAKEAQVPKSGHRSVSARAGASGLGIGRAAC